MRERRPVTAERAIAAVRAASVALPPRGLTTAEALMQGVRRGGVRKLSAETIPLHLLIVEPEGSLLRPLLEIGREMGFTVDALTAEQVREGLPGVTGDIILLDIQPTAPSLELLQKMRNAFPRVPILAMTAFASVQTAVEALRIGATDFLSKPFSLEELTTTLRSAAERRTFDLEARRMQQQMRSSPGLQETAAASPAMQKLMGMVTRVANSNHPMVVLGESGSGKERLVRMLHTAASNAAVSAGKQALPFHHVACDTTASTVLETEMFGYVRNEGTPEREERVGLLTEDAGGTLFLDEIDGLSLDVQARLLRALQAKQVKPAGSGMSRPITVRVVASSSRDLPAMVERGAFRKDLYFRLSVVNLRVPPLRERREDIPLLAAVFLERHSRARHLSFSLGPDAMRVLLEYEWPGNVRELEAVIERACSLSSGPVLHLIDLPSQIQHRAHEAQAEAEAAVRFENRQPETRRESGDSAIESIAEMERRVILSTLGKLNGDKLMTAKLLGIGKTTLYRKLKEYGIADFA